MKIITLSIFFFLATQSLAQFKPLSRFNHCDSFESAYGSKVEPNKNYGIPENLCTKLYYKSREFMLRNTNNKEKKKIKKKAKGGLIHLFITRETIGAALPRNFKLIILNTSEEELWATGDDEESFIHFKPYEFDSKWANSGSILINKEMPGQFKVKLIEKLADGNEETFEFIVTK